MAVKSKFAATFTKKSEILALCQPKQFGAKMAIMIIHYLFLFLKHFIEFIIPSKWNIEDIVCI